MTRAIGRFLLVSMRPLGRSPDAADWWTLAQGVGIFLGFGVIGIWGGLIGEWVRQSPAVTKIALVLSLFCILFFWAGVRITKRILTYETPVLLLDWQPELHSARSHGALLKKPPEPKAAPHG